MKIFTKQLLCYTLLMFTFLSYSTGQTSVTLGECKKCDSEITVTFNDCDDCIDITSCKDISNVVLLLADSSHYKFDGLSGKNKTICSVDGQDILGAWVKAGCKKSGDGPGYGRFFAGPCDGGENDYGSITGSVSAEDTGFGLSGVVINLYEDTNADGIEDGVILSSDTTDANGNYEFIDVAVGDYVIVQEQPLGYVTVSEEDETSGVAFNDVDNAPDISTEDNRIPATLDTDEVDADNNFIEVEDIPVLPGELVLQYTITPFFVDEVTDIVVYRYEITNPGQGDVYNVQLSDLDAINGINYLNGDTNGDDILAANDAETWVFESARTWTWAQGDVITSNAIATGVDGSDNPLSDEKSVDLFTIGANMEILCDHTSVNPGDVIEITLVSRLYVSDQIIDAQLGDLEIKCNLMGGNMWQVAGPGNMNFSDPTGDYINSTPGAYSIAVDKNDAADYGTAPDWSHTFTYTVPMDQATDLVISADDRGLVRGMDANGIWHDGSILERNSICVIPLANQNLVQQNDDSGIASGQTLSINNDVEQMSETQIEAINRSVSIESSALKTWPNPANDVLNLSFGKELVGQSGVLQLVGTNGAVHTQKSYDLIPSTAQLNTSELLEGVYFVKIETMDSFSTSTIVIK